MLNLSVYNINYLVKFLDYGYRGILNFLCSQIKIKDEININGFLLENDKLFNWFLKNFNFDLDILSVKYCMKKNYINGLKYYKINNYKIDEHKLYYAVKNKNYDIILWFINNYDLSYYIYSLSALFGEFDLLKYLMKKKVILHPQICAYAVRRGNLDILKYLRKLNCPWDYHTTTNCANRGYLDILKYTIKNGCPYNENTFYWASRRGKLDIIKYLHSINCPYDKYKAIKLANRYKFNNNIVIWLNSI